MCGYTRDMCAILPSFDVLTFIGDVAAMLLKCRRSSRYYCIHVAHHSDAVVCCHVVRCVTRGYPVRILLESKIFSVEKLRLRLFRISRPLLSSHYSGWSIVVSAPGGGITIPHSENCVVWLFG